MLQRLLEFTPFASDERLSCLKKAGVSIGMDGKSRWIDKLFIERLWRSVKYEEAYLHAYENGSEARAALTKYFEFYNARRTHQSHGYRTPDAVYFDDAATAMPKAA